MQRESFVLGTRCITLRENTEWPETYLEGRNQLVGLDEDKILAALELPVLKNAPKARPFGLLGACRRVVEVVTTSELRAR